MKLGTVLMCNEALRGSLFPMTPTLNIFKHWKQKLLFLLQESFLMKKFKSDQMCSPDFQFQTFSRMFYYKFCFGKVGLGRIWQQHFEGFGLSAIGVFMDSIASRGLPIRRLLLGHGFGSEHARLSTAQLSDPGVWHGGGGVKSIFLVWFCWQMIYF